MRIICILVIAVSATSFKSGLNANANFLKNNHPTEYERTIKKHSIDDWNDDYEMVIYEINNQADALMELVESFKSKYTDIAYKAIQEWSHEGHQLSNANKFQNLTKFNISGLIGLHCDWPMVQYQYNNQVVAKESLE